MLYYCHILKVFLKLEVKNIKISTICLFNIKNIICGVFSAVTILRWLCKIFNLMNLMIFCQLYMYSMVDTSGVFWFNFYIFYIIYLHVLGLPTQVKLLQLWETMANQAISNSRRNFASTHISKFCFGILKFCLHILKFIFPISKFGLHISKFCLCS